ncbi:MAG: hypothetical protein AB7L90_07240 [Hyphomicrobiaceae bacterium]|uniref:hypothetical protein n=1 Tax=Pseudorhodoplanes sp. TaxID=1934341 RepID=UPI003D0DFD74
MTSEISDECRPRRATWTCHLHEHLGPFDEPVEILQRFSSSREMVAKFVARALKLEVRDHDANWRRSSFATLKMDGKSRAFSIEFDGHAVVKLGSASIDLVELLEWDSTISIDRAALAACFNASVDTLSGEKRIQPSTTVREVAKLTTQLRVRKLQRRIDVLATKHPQLNKEQLAKKLVKAGEGEGMSAGRIARVTRMPKKLRRKNFA